MSKAKKSSNIDLKVGVIVVIAIIIILFLLWTTIASAVTGNLATAAGSFILVIILLSLVGSTINVNSQWEEAIILRLGKYNRSVGPGVFFRIPAFEKVYRRDMRIRTLDIRKQEVITKDNISVRIDAVVFMKVKDAKRSVIEIQDFIYSVRQYSQPTLRNVVGKYELDELLTQREKVALEVRKIVDQATEEWGVDISIVELQDIELPEDMKRIIARQAEAEREKRGVIIKSEGELQAAENLKKAADTLAKAPTPSSLPSLWTASQAPWQPHQDCTYQNHENNKNKNNPQPHTTPFFPPTKRDYLNSIERVIISIYPRVEEYGLLVLPIEGEHG
jgi:regulator of protease activity HflC (stomatin/prohibitin superfamily)